MSGKVVWSPISQASTIWSETKGEQSSNPRRGCPSTGRVGKPKKCRCAAEFCAPPARRARPTGSCHRLPSLFEKSEARRVGTKMSRSATKTEGQTGSSIQDRMLRLPGFLHWWNQQKPKHTTDRTQTSDEEWWRQQSHCWAPFTDETSNWLGLCDMYNVFYRLLPTSYFRKLVY